MDVDGDLVGNSLKMNDSKIVHRVATSSIDTWVFSRFYLNDLTHLLYSTIIQFQCRS